jgi:hypothetical protein
MRTAMTLAALSAALLLAQGCASAKPSPPPFMPADLVGEWDSGPCSAFVRAQGVAPAPARRQYLFTSDRFEVRYTFFADGACTRPLFVVFMEGPYQLGGAVAGNPIARTVDVTFERRLLTIEAPEMLPRVAACGAQPWKVGVQQDISGTGCLAYKPIAQCSADYDITTIAGDVLYPGLRTPDMCTPAGRPTLVQDTMGAKKLKPPAK